MTFTLGYEEFLLNNVLVYDADSIEYTCHTTGLHIKDGNVVKMNIEL